MRALGAPVTLASNASRVSFEDVHLDVPRPLVAIHIRRGDACTTKGVNYGRPPCQNLETYLADLAEVERRYAADEPSARVQSIFVATDSADVISEIRALNDSRMWWLSGVDRAKYAPEGSQKIENFMASAKRVDALRDFWTEVTVMAQADAVIGQCYSTMFDMAVFGGRHKGYRCTDEGYPCARGGCPRRSRAHTTQVQLDGGSSVHDAEGAGDVRPALRRALRRLPEEPRDVLPDAAHPQLPVPLRWERAS